MIPPNTQTNATMGTKISSMIFIFFIVQPVGQHVGYHMLQVIENFFQYRFFLPFSATFLGHQYV